MTDVVTLALVAVQLGLTITGVLIAAWAALVLREERRNLVDAVTELAEEIRTFNKKER